LGELLEGVGVEEVSVSGELAGGVLELGKVDVSSAAVNDGGDVLSQESDDLEGLVVLLEGLDEHKIGVASLFSEGFSSLVDVNASVVDPRQVFGGDLDLVFDVLSVSGGFVTNGLVGVGDPGQVRDLFAELGFLGPVDLVSVSLGVNVGLLKVSQESEGAFDGVNGLGLHVQQGGQLASELGSFLRSASGNAQNEER